MTERRWKYSKAIRLWRFLRWTMTRKPRVYFAYAAGKAVVALAARDVVSLGTETERERINRLKPGLGDDLFDRHPSEEVSPSGVVNPQGKMTPAQIEQAKLEGKFR